MGAEETSEVLVALLVAAAAVVQVASQEEALREVCWAANPGAVAMARVVASSALVEEGMALAEMGEAKEVGKSVILATVEAVGLVAPAVMAMAMVAAKAVVVAGKAMGAMVASRRRSA